MSRCPHFSSAPTLSIVSPLYFRSAIAQWTDFEVADHSLVYGLATDDVIALSLCQTLAINCRNLSQRFESSRQILTNGVCTSKFYLRKKNVLLVVCPCGTSPKIGCELTGNDVLEKFLPVLHLLISPNPQPRESLGHHRRFHNQFPPFCSVLHCTLGLGESRPVHSLMLSSHLFFCVPCLLSKFTKPCKMVFARLMNGRNVRISSVCVSLRWSGLRVVRLPFGAWHVGTIFLVGNMVFVRDA